MKQVPLPGENGVPYYWGYLLIAKSNNYGVNAKRTHMWYGPRTQYLDRCPPLCQKRLAYVAKETHLCGKRDSPMWQKRLTYVAKETRLCDKRDSGQETPTYEVCVVGGVDEIVREGFVHVVTQVKLVPGNDDVVVTH